MESAEDENANTWVKLHLYSRLNGEDHLRLIMIETVRVVLGLCCQGMIKPIERFVITMIEMAGNYVQGFFGWQKKIL